MCWIWVIFYKNFRFCKITVVESTLKVLLGITEMFDGTRNHLSIKHYPVALNKCTFLVPKDSKCTFYKEIDNKEANVLGRYGYFSQKFQIL